MFAEMLTTSFCDQRVFSVLFVHFRKFDIVDTMLKKLEKYADNLESIVQQRTAELNAEKLKTDELLYQMMPPSVYHFD